MIKPVFYINGREVTEPLNYQELDLELNYDKDDPSYRGQVSTNSWQIGVGDQHDPVKDGAKQVEKWIFDGIGGIGGVFEGLPFRIDLKGGGTTDTIFDGYLDLTTGSFRCDLAEVNAVETGGIDWLNENADGFTFEYLAEPKFNGGLEIITNDDYVLIPYLIKKPDDYVETAVLIISLFVVIQEFNNIFESVGEAILKLPTLLDTPAAIIELIVDIIRLIIVIFAIVKLVKALINLVFQKVKYKAGMYAYDLCRIGAEHLGYKFESSILNSAPFNSMVILPESYNQVENEKGITRNFYDKIGRKTLGIEDASDRGKLRGEYRGTFGDLLRELKTMFNAKLVITENDIGEKILRLERVDYKNGGRLYKLPPIDKSELSYRFNTDEFAAHYNISFTPDLNDKNVWQEYIGTELQVITRYRQVFNKLNVLFKGERLNRIGFALTARKNSLNFTERLVNELLNGVSRVMGAFERRYNKFVFKVTIAIIKLNNFIDKLNNLGANILVNLTPPRPINVSRNLSNLISNRRIGAMVMENDFVNTPKVMIMNESYETGKTSTNVKLSLRNREFLNAAYLWDNYHYINSFAGTRDHNQHRIYTVSDIPFCYQDYLLVKNNDYILDSDGVTQAQVISVKWNIYSQTAEITYKVKEKYTFNLKEQKIFSDGR